MKFTEMEILGLRLYNGYGVNRLKGTAGIQFEGMTREQRQRTEDKSVHSADILKSAVSEVGVKQVAAN